MSEVTSIRKTENRKVIMKQCVSCKYHIAALVSNMYLVAHPLYHYTSTRGMIIKSYELMMTPTQSSDPPWLMIMNGCKIPANSSGNSTDFQVPKQDNFYTEENAMHTGSDCLFVGRGT